MPRRFPDTATTGKRKAARPPALRTGRLKAADPFELIRWLARSQPDPRKALAELVQNSLDAGARVIKITRLRRAGVPELRILDDGEGVIPDLSREEALAYLATHIGHSRKRELTPEQRRELMLQGKYGIGLLGFWSIGRVLEIRSYVPGEEPLVLTLHEESPSYEIDRLRGRLALGDAPWTEVVVRELHAPALKSLVARRAADFLGSELRGQLLAHQAQVLVYDGIARGRGTKVVEVRPRRFEGERLSLPESIATNGHSPITVELYLLAPGATEPGKVALSQAGTVVYDDIVEFAAADLARPPWTNPRLGGVIDFADFQVPPGTRRAVVLDQAAEAFLEALVQVEALVSEQLDLEQERANAELEAGMLRQLERAFRELPRRDPVYDFFELLAPDRRAIAAGSVDAASEASPSGLAELPQGIPIDDSGADDSASGPAQMTIAGPLASAAIAPAASKVERLGRRRLRVRAFDAAGLPIARPLDVEWRVAGGVARIEPASNPATGELHAGAETGSCEIVAIVREGDSEASARATVEVIEDLGGADASRTGIPEPVLIDDPGAPWRSRMIDKRWEVNSGHEDYRETSDSYRRKLRYLAALLAKEIVLHSFPMPSLAPVLERMVEVLTITDRRLERS